MSRQSDRASWVLEQAVKLSGGDLSVQCVTPDLEEFAILKGSDVRAKIESVLIGKCSHEGLQYLCDSGALEAYVPEVYALVGFGEGGHKHKDVWEHTKRVVIQSPPRPLVRWAALLHDIGKVPTRKIDTDGQILFHGHAEIGARMAKRVLKRLRFPKDDAEYVRTLVLFHQRPSQYEPSWTDSAVRRFGKETSLVLGDLLDLSRADMTTKYDIKRQRGHELIDDLEHRVHHIREEDMKVPPLPKGLGTAIMEHFCLSPGPQIGVLRKALESAIDEGELAPHQETEIYLSWLSKHMKEH